MFIVYVLHRSWESLINILQLATFYVFRFLLAPAQFLLNATAFLHGIIKYVSYDYVFTCYSPTGNI
jgi:hypothetical protein